MSKSIEQDRNDIAHRLVEDLTTGQPTVVGALHRLVCGAELLVVLDNTIVNVVDHPRDRGDFGCGCAGFDHAVVDAVPDTLMNPDQKNFAGETVISVIEIVTSPTLALTDEPAQELVIPPRRSVHAWRTLL